MFEMLRIHALSIVAVTGKRKGGGSWKPQDLWLIGAEQMAEQDKKVWGDMTETMDLMKRMQEKHGIKIYNGS